MEWSQRVMRAIKLNLLKTTILVNLIQWQPKKTSHEGEKERPKKGVLKR